MSEQSVYVPVKKLVDFMVAALLKYEEGINAVAAPILDPNGQPLAAITVAGPAYRLLPERMNEIGQTVLATAREIAQEIRLHPIQA